jgi:hypothetical protein
MYRRMDITAHVHTHSQNSQTAAYWIGVKRTVSDLCTGSFGDEIIGHCEEIIGHREEIISHCEEIIGHREEKIGHCEEIIGHCGRV